MSSKSQNFCGFLHRGTDTTKVFDRKSFLENKARREIQRPCSAHGEIIDSAVNGEFANVAAGEKYRIDHVRIGRKSQFGRRSILSGSVNTLLSQQGNLEDAQFVPCVGAQDTSIGFVPPRGVEHGAMMEHMDGHIIMTVMIERKMVPGAVVLRKYAERVTEIEAQTGRKPGRKEGREIRDDIRLGLMPTAFPKQIKVPVWIYPKAARVVIGSTSGPRVDEVLSLLVQNIEGFMCEFLAISESPASVMAAALSKGEFNADFTIDRECELKASDESRATIRYAKHALDIDEISDHIKAGKMPTKLALTWKDRVSFVLNENFQLKKINVLDVVFSDRLVGEGSEDNFDADVAIETAELAPLISDLIEAHGGRIEVGEVDDEL